MGRGSQEIHSKANCLSRKITITIELNEEEAEQLIEALLDKENKDGSTEEKKRTTKKKST